jgi:hypothetical protein
VQVDTDKAVAWLQKGAQPTESAAKVLSIAGVWDAYKTTTGKDAVAKPVAKTPKPKAVKEEPKAAAPEPAAEASDAGEAADASGAGEAEASEDASE